MALLGLVQGDRQLCSFMAAKLQVQLGGELMSCLVDEHLGMAL